MPTGPLAGSGQSSGTGQGVVNDGEAGRSQTAEAAAATVTVTRELADVAPLIAPRSQGTVSFGVHQPCQLPYAQLDPPPISHPGPAQRRRLNIVDSLVVLANLLAAQARSSPSLHPAAQAAAPTPAERTTVSFRVGRTSAVASAASSPTADAHRGQRLETPPKTMPTYGGPEKPQVNEGVLCS